MRPFLTCFPVSPTALGTLGVLTGLLLCATSSTSQAGDKPPLWQTMVLCYPHANCGGGPTVAETLAKCTGASYKKLNAFNHPVDPCINKNPGIGGSGFPQPGTKLPSP